MWSKDTTLSVGEVIFVEREVVNSEFKGRA